MNAYAKGSEGESYTRTVPKEFWLGVASSLLAAVVFVVATVAAVRLRTAASLNGRSIGAYISMTRRMAKAGVSNFFSERTDYARHQQYRTVSEYMLSASAEYVYVGFWLAHGTEVANIQRAIRAMLESGRRVELVFLDSNVDDVVLDRTAQYLALSSANLTARLRSAWDDMENFERTLSVEQRRRFRLLAHQQILTSSAQIVDQGHPGTRVLLDVKLFGVGREGSFGLEVQPSRAGGDLYDRIVRSFNEIKASAVVRAAIPPAS